MVIWSPWARARSGSGATARRDEHRVPQDRRRNGLRPGQRDRRRGARHLDRRRQDRRAARRPRRQADPRDRRPGLVVMPGGVDMHCHIVGPKVNTARKMCPEQKRARPSRSAAPGSRTAARWAACPARSPPATSTPGWATPRPSTPRSRRSPPGTRTRSSRTRPASTRASIILMGNNHYLMRSIQQGRAGEGRRRSSAGCWARRRRMPPSSSIPAASRSGRRHRAGNVDDLDSPVDHFGVTPRQIIGSVAQAVDELKLPHPVHIHANNLGLPGNWTTTLETMKVLEGHRGHMTHIQFHSYGGGVGDEDTFSLEGRSAGRIRQRAPEPHGRRRPGRLRRDHEHDRRRAASATT